MNLFLLAVLVFLAGVWVSNELFQLYVFICDRWTDKE